MSYAKTMTLLLSMWAFVACASGKNLLQIDVIGKKNEIHHISVTNEYTEVIKFSIYVEVFENGEWFEYPHRIEDGAIEPQRKIHEVKANGKIDFSWDIQRDKLMAPPLPKGVLDQEARNRARVRLDVFNDKERTKSVVSVPFDVDL